jgi:lipoate-protein ligase B
MCTPCQLQIQDLGKIAYEPALKVQREVQRSVIEQRGCDDAELFHLLMLEHDPPVITVSRRKGAEEHLLATEQQLLDAGVTLCNTDRGGDITYHGPGQLVGYPICDLNALSLRLHGYMRFLEGCIIDVLSQFGIDAHRDDRATGVWVGDSKICALGVRISRWVSMHGFAINVSPDLSHFDLIVPCGLAGKTVTSMSILLGDNCPSIEEVKSVVAKTFEGAIGRQARVRQAPHR